MNDKPYTVASVVRHTEGNSAGDLVGYAGTSPSLKSNPNRRAIVLVAQNDWDATAMGSIVVGVRRGAVLIPIACVSSGNRFCIVTSDQVGDIIKEEIFVSAIGTTVEFTLAEFFDI